MLSQHFSPVLIDICSGLIPIFTLSPGETLSEVFGTIIFPCPEISTSVSELLELITLELIKFIFGEPIKPPTNKFSGSLYNFKGVPF